ncbi:hypothetical protein TRFO_34846 [Tritrichomonas foetus]|uniref:Myb-like DNA-binding domain containing protein n=1 Tax=Tritrichomonas foetus TaxID=1144522 RepID=A0A1J4JHQ5_9EUKA|nr:hypothetical protein TRFO_34846 [Tritrichomonas foetus]|eukprot:OHS98690.1 hypothetical protein TRFO_34846 [Tritrichomonas foetus]
MKTQLLKHIILMRRSARSDASSSSSSTSKKKKDKDGAQQKNKFSADEDAILLASVRPGNDAANDWNEISKLLVNKTARQCKDRWNNYLNPCLTTEEWTIEEDEKLLEKYAESGPRWKMFTQIFKNRSINNIRNRCMRLIRRQQYTIDEHEAGKIEYSYNSSNFSSSNDSLNELSNETPYEVVVSNYRSNEVNDEMAMKEILENSNGFENLLYVNSNQGINHSNEKMTNSNPNFENGSLNFERNESKENSNMVFNSPNFVNHIENATQLEHHNHHLRCHSNTINVGNVLMVNNGYSGNNQIPNNYQSQNPQKRGGESSLIDLLLENIKEDIHKYDLWFEPWKTEFNAENNNNVKEKNNLNHQHKK